MESTFLKRLFGIGNEWEYQKADVIGRKVIKGTRYLLLRGRENLPISRVPDLEEALKLNEPLSQAYYLKEEVLEGF